MNGLDHRTSSPPAGGPARFLQQGGAGPPTRSGRPQAVLAAVAALVVLAGTPLALLSAGGPPAVPTSLPDRAALTQALDVEQLLAVLVTVVWLAWAQFTVCFVVEVLSAVRGVGMPAKVPMSGPTQRLARSLVGALLITAAVAGPAAAAGAPGPVVEGAGAAGPTGAGRVAAGQLTAGQPTPGLLTAGQSAAGLLTAGQLTAGQLASGPSSASGAGWAPGAVGVPAGPATAAAVGPGGAGRAVEDRAAGDRAVEDRAAEDLAAGDLAAGDLAAGDLAGQVIEPLVEADGLVGRKVYTVQAPQDGRHDSLWAIAERHLGEGRRYHEIYALNVGRAQSDGRQLELSRLIQPGWNLVMPEDAQGVSRVVRAPGRAVPLGRVAADLTAAGAGVAGDGAAGVAGAGATGVAGSVAGVESPFQADQRAPAPDTAHTAEAGADRSASALPQNLAGGGLLAAGLLTALYRARRRPGQEALDQEAIEAEVALRVGADLARWAGLDLTLGDLARRCAEEGLPLPAVFAARVGDQVELLLAPASARAPHGWEVVADGTCWRAPLVAGDEPVPAGEVRPYPSLVSIGRDSAGRDVLIVLAAADGPVALTGDPAGAGEIGVAMAVSLAVAPWSGDLSVRATGLPDDVRAVLPGRLTEIDDVPAAVASALAQSPAGDGVLTGATDDQQPAQVLVLMADPGRAVVEALGGSNGQRARGVLVAADLPGATWRLHVDEAGTVQVRPLDLTVTGYRLSGREVAVLARMLGTARAAGPAQAAAAPADPPIGLQIDDAGWLASPCRLSVLGPAQVRAGGALDPARIALATELLVFLALHRDGVHPTVLGGALWPRGVGADVRDATVRRARDWLGDDPRGASLLLTLPDGRLKLSEQVPSDWDVVCTLAARARAARGRPEEADLLRRALRVVRGPLLSAGPPGRYSWVPRTGLEGQVHQSVVGLAHRLSVLVRGDDPPAAEAAATSGLRFAPREQLLWRDVLLAAAAQDGADPGGTSAQLPAAVHRMRSMLADLGDPSEPETDALVEDLLPGLVARQA